MLDFLNRYLLITPDFGRSDAWHSYFSLKFVLSEALKNNYLPLWNKEIGTGVPLLGDGQIGLFNIVNLVLFRLFPPVAAFNLAILSIILICLIGTYFYLRTISLSKTTAIFAALVFSLSGFWVVQATHFSLIQAASFMPLEFFFAEKYLQTKKRLLLLGLTLTISQQIFSGFPQMLVISLICLSLYVLLRLWGNYSVKTVVALVLATAVGLAIGTPQLISSWQLARHSVRQLTLNVGDIAKYPYNPKNFLTFFNPYQFRDPRTGINNKLISNQEIFWETTAYIGIVPLVILIPLAFFRKNKRFAPLRLTLVIMTVISIILVLGKFTIFFFVFQIPPLSFFRIPSRFLILLTWSLVILAAIGFETIKSPKLRLILVLVCLADILNFALHYHAVVDAQKWLQPPQTVTILEKDISWYRIYSIFPGNNWNDIIYKRGWSKPEEFLPFRNTLDPNQNVFWRTSSSNSYVALASNRLTIFNQLTQDGILLDGDTKLLISSESAKLISLSGAKYLISLRDIASQSAIQLPIFGQTSIGDFTYKIYLNTSARPHAYLTDNFTIANNLIELITKLTDPNISLPVLENRPPFASGSGQIWPATVLVNSDLKVIVATDAPNLALLILSDSYYPGWQAYLDDRKTPIFPANLNQRAIVVPAGQHIVRFQYEPFSSLASFLE